MNKPDSSRRELPGDDSFLDEENTVCATECTGLIPSAPLSPSESNDMASLMAIHVPPFSMTKDPGPQQPADENEHPYDERNPPTKTPSSHPASIPALYRPGANQDH